jgi:hypothetical protein
VDDNAAAADDVDDSLMIATNNGIGYVFCKDCIFYVLFLALPLCAYFFEDTMVRQRLP